MQGCDDGRTHRHKHAAASALCLSAQGATARQGEAARHSTTSHNTSRDSCQRKGLWVVVCVGDACQTRQLSVQCSHQHHRDLA